VEKEMKRIPFLAIVLLAFAFPAHAQDAMKNDAMKKDAAVKPADPELKVVLDSWNEIGRKLTAMAEDFPEDKYDFKPTPAQRSFAEQLLHAAGANYFFTNPVMGKAPQAAEDPKRDQYKSKADIVRFVKKSFADGAAAIQSKGEKGLTTEVVYYPGQKARVLDIAYGIIEHSGEHYGQLVVYYRLAGLVPPESMGHKDRGQTGRLPISTLPKIGEGPVCLHISVPMFHDGFSADAMAASYAALAARYSSIKPARVSQNHNPALASTAVLRTGSPATSTMYFRIAS
jgi:pentapeptide MXKDX repeat protein